MSTFLGLDLGSSSIKAALVDASTLTLVASAQSPEDRELPIDAPLSGWAEQDPEMWWQHACQAIKAALSKAGESGRRVAAIGISYQMHGLVCLDAAGKPLRPAIIWCDSRAVETGEQMLRMLGPGYCLSHCLNPPGNFTAAKLRWVRDNEPQVFERIDKIALPGDYLAFRLSGELSTTLSGLSEGIFWDFPENRPAKRLLETCGLPDAMLPPLSPTLGFQGGLSRHAAAELGLSAGIPITYRAGDQPNNALAVNVLRPGEMAANGGTSGVLYGITDRMVGDAQGRVNSFAHVNHSAGDPGIGVLLCINGTGSLYRWLRQNLQDTGFDYPGMEQLALAAAPGADGLRILPFGNGAERMLGNRSPGAQVLNLDFNRHGAAHLCRAGLEGIAFAFAHGAQLMKELGLQPSVLRATNSGLFQSGVFASTLATLLDCNIEVLDTNGAVGAALAAGSALSDEKPVEEILAELKIKRAFEPDKLGDFYREQFGLWEESLKKALAR